MAIAHVVTATPAGGINGATTGSFDSTGCDLLVIFVGSYLAVTAPALSDNKGNTGSFTLATTGVGTTNSRVQMYYKLNPAVGSGHTFTVSQTGSYSTVSVSGFSGVSAFDQAKSAANDSNTSIQPGSITPPEDNCLFVAGGYFNQTGDTASIDLSFTERSELAPSANNTGATMNDLIQTTAAARNPTITKTGSNNNIGAAMVTFKPTTAGVALDSFVIPIIYWG